MALESSRTLFVLPNAKRMIVELSGVRIVDKRGNTVLDATRREAWFDHALDADDRRLLSALKINPRR
jgi:hypothetical protein